MTEDEAIKIAKIYLENETGVDGEPETIRFIERTNCPPYWLIIFSAKIFFPKTYEEGGGVVDGGECILEIEDESKTVRIFM